MPTIRELVGALRQRTGVEAAIVLGRDGLLIESEVAPDLDAESMSALVPSIVSACDEFGGQAERGELTTAILEYPNGIAIVSALSANAVLLMLVKPAAEVGELMYELRRHRDHIAALV